MQSRAQSLKPEFENPNNPSPNACTVNLHQQPETSHSKFQSLLGCASQVASRSAGNAALYWSYMGDNGKENRNYRDYRDALGVILHDKGLLNNFDLLDLKGKWGNGCQ